MCACVCERERKREREIELLQNNWVQKHELNSIDERGGVSVIWIADVM